MRKAKASVLAILKLARVLLARGPTIAKGFSARDRFGAPVHWGDRYAVSFCPVGAIYRAAEELDGARTVLPLTPRLIAEDRREEAAAILDAHLPARAKRLGMSVPRFADECPRAHVLVLFDRGIESLQSRRRIFDEAG